MPRSAAKKAPVKKTTTTTIAPGISITAPVLEPPAATPAPLIHVDWQNIPMPDAQTLYAQLKESFEQAGRILNARAMAATQVEFYECFMAGKPKCCAKGTQHRMPARGTDYENGHKDPKSGLVTPVLICSENCWIRYQEVLINERRDRNLRSGTL
jgi:hypothetical protein